MAKFAHHYSLDRQMKELISSLELTWA
jgi:hypothetical protein